MGLFDEPLVLLNDYLKGKRAEGVLVEHSFNPFSAWPEKQSLVLKDDTAIELGNPGLASIFMLLWTDREDLISPDTVSLIGQDLEEQSAGSLPFAQVVLVRGSFPDEYDAYRDLRDVVYDTRLEGVSTRFWPDRFQTWCRVSKQALEAGFNLNRYGQTLLKKLRRVDGVDTSQVIFVTRDRSEVELLKPMAEKTQDIVEALIKMYEEMNFDCDTCEYVEVCEEVVELRKIRERLRGEREGA